MSTYSCPSDFARLDFAFFLVADGTLPVSYSGTTLLAITEGRSVPVFELFVISQWETRSLAGAVGEGRAENLPPLHRSHLTSLEVLTSYTATYLPA